MNDIPKKIHYCWFGGADLPDSAQKCIESWKRFFPGYEIIQWNEQNYDVTKNTYIRQAYQAKKYAFVSDFARYDILFHEGGLYFDTDVEVVKSFDDIVSAGAFWGLEIDGIRLNDRTSKASGLWIYVNPGLGMGAPSGLSLYQEILDYYEHITFLDADGQFVEATVVEHLAAILQNKKIAVRTDGKQEVEGITIYPSTYFNPRDSATGRVIRTEHTHSIHWYSMSWLPKLTRLRAMITRQFHRVFGKDCFSTLRAIERRLKGKN